VGFQPVSTDELKMTSEPLAPGAPAIILYRQVDRDDNLETGHEDDYFRIKILTEEGRRLANIQIPFGNGIEDVTSINGRTIKPDGSIANLDGRVFEKELLKMRGSKALAKTFALPDVEVGSIIEYFFTLHLAQHKLFGSAWILNDALFTKKAQFSLKPYAAPPPNKYSLRWTWHDLPASARPQIGPDQIVRMEVENIPAFQAEDYMPPANEVKSRVNFIYEQGIVERDPESYWKRIGKERSGALESFIGRPQAMQDAVARIVSPGDSQEVKLRKIYDRVQQFRNTSYEQRKTEQEAKREKEKLAQNVEEMWQRGYATGVQLTWLFLGLVRAAGLEAYGCWVSDRRQYFFNPVTEEAGKLSDNVVLVRLGGKDLYLDPGAAFTPYGMLRWSETGVGGLRLDKEGGSWIHTTLPQASESGIRRVGSLKLSDTGDLDGTLTMTYTGLQAMYHRLEQQHADEVARKKVLESLVTSQIGVASEADLTNKPDWDSSEQPLVAEFHLKIPGWAANAGKKVMIPAAIFTAGEKKTFEHADRVYPIYFHYPHQKLDEITIELPPGWQVASLPAGQDQDGHVVHYALKVEQGPGTLKLTRKLTIEAMLLEQKYYAALRSFFQMVRTNDGEAIVLQPGEIPAGN
jgi:hypothetical protein